MMCRIIYLGLLSCVFLSTSPAQVFAQTYEIQIRNRAQQGLTSSVCAIHRRNSTIVEMGGVASEGLKGLAEDGVTGQFRREVAAIKGVRKTATGPFIASKRKATFRISSRKRGRLSCVFGMLVATNDGFAADFNARLPREVGDSKSIRGMAYDAGTEVNTESCDHVPGGPCDSHFIGEAENGTVQLHPGILGIADLSAEEHGWPEVVVRGKITRVE